MDSQFNEHTQALFLFPRLMECKQIKENLCSPARKNILGSTERKSVYVQSGQLRVANGHDREMAQVHDLSSSNSFSGASSNLVHHLLNGC